MSARRQSGGRFHRFIQAIRDFVEAFKRARNGRQSTGGRVAGGPGGRGRNPQPQCPSCHRFVPALCMDAEEGAEPCGLGLICCCGGPHLAPKGAEGGADGGKFQTSAQKAAE